MSSNAYYADLKRQTELAVIATAIDRRLTELKTIRKMESGKAAGRKFDDLMIDPTT